MLPAAAGDHLDYRELIGPEASPSPMQEWARDVDLPAGPALFIIEDETGSGKTEAAVMLAHRLIASGAADGLYVALPTMATANAMFDRLAGAYRHLFATDTEPSIALAHGARDMHRGFRAANVTRWARRRALFQFGCTGRRHRKRLHRPPARRGLPDDRRRTFLADAGAGTLDQALLSVLPSRHQSLRLLGLMRRVLILDEVHAYDAYMQREMERLLEFQAGLGRLGNSAVRDPTEVGARTPVTNAFAEGLGAQGPKTRVSAWTTRWPRCARPASTRQRGYRGNPGERAHFR